MLGSLVLMLLQAVQPPTFAATVQMVGVTVTATDARTGASVSGLQQEDFDVYEEGKRQSILYFAHEDVPASVVIMLDASTSVRYLLPTIRDAAEHLIRSLRPIDEVQLISFDDQYRILCDFTENQDEAIESLKSLRQGHATALTRSVYIASRSLELRHQRDAKRRRILILLSDGENTEGSFSYESAEQALLRSSIVCYIVHLERGEVPGFSQQIKDLRALRDRGAEFVQKVTRESGGKLLKVHDPYPADVIITAFSGIASDIGSQYQLGYVMANTPRMSGWRTIGVALRSSREVRLQFRKSFYAVADP